MMMGSFCSLRQSRIWEENLKISDSCPWVEENSKRLAAKRNLKNCLKSARPLTSGMSNLLKKEVNIDLLDEFS